MPRNPLTHELFQPTLLRVAFLLGTAIVLILAVERGNLRQWRSSVLFKRVASWAVMAPIFALGVFSGGLISLLLVVYMSVQALIEFCRLVGVGRGYRSWIIAYDLFALGVTAYFGQRFFLFMPLGFFAVATLMPLLRLSDRSREPRAEVMQSAAVVLGYLWIALPLSFFVLIGTAEEDAVAILLLIGFAVALSDVLAFSAGKLLRGPLLTPVSPNKTWWGLAGNLAGAYLAFWLMEFAIPAEYGLATRLVVPAVIAAGAVWGDLVESLAKRGFGAKDAGDLIPGFGGLLDRIDSLLLAMPLGYYAIKVVQHYAG